MPQLVESGPSGEVDTQAEGAATTLSDSDESSADPGLGETLRKEPGDIYKDRIDRCDSY